MRDISNDRGENSVFIPRIFMSARTIKGVTAGFVLCLFISGFSVTSAWSTDYYVSSSKGSDQLSGLSPAQPWKTLNKVKNLVLTPGDRILLKRGDIWREDLAIVGSGSETGSLEITAYGEGPKPVLNGSVVLSDWTLVGKGIYRTDYKGICQGLLEDGKPSRKASGKELTDGGWYYDGVQIYFKPSEGGAAAHLVEGCSKPGLQIISRNHVSLDGIAIYGYAGGIWVVNSSHLQIRNCAVKANAAMGIGIANHPKKVGSPCSDIWIQGNTVSWNANGIYLISEHGAQGLKKIYVIGNLVEYNDFEEVWTKIDGHGLGIQNTSGSYFGENEFRYNRTGPCLWTAPNRRSDNNVFARNFVHHNQKFGMNQGGEGKNNATGNIWCFNIISDNGTDKGLNGGFRINRCQSGKNEFFNNTLARNDVNFYLYSLTDYAIIKQNISYSPKSYHVLIEGGLDHNVFTDNLYYPDGTGLFGIGTARKLNFAAWRTKTRQERGSLVCDPGFSNPNLNLPEHFRPVRTSPALSAPKKSLMPPEPTWVKSGGADLHSETQIQRPDEYLGLEYFGQHLGSKSFIGASSGQP
jgi:hypothetical protein